jgi:bifunctional DNA-binding transcriptional regulator/antitoxin component of YhaV-PrlF toxin-antitoxin module
MVKFTETIVRFGKQGEKTGWTYIPISAAIANLLKPANRQSFRVKGSLDGIAIASMALIPLGEGAFILPLNAEMRRKLGKRKGDSVELRITEDKKPYELCADLLACLRDEPTARDYFNQLTGSHQRYFSKWIESAKTASTRDKRIVLTVNALAKGWGYPEMIRAGKNEH